MNNPKSLFLWGGLALVVVLAVALGLFLVGNSSSLNNLATGKLTVPVSADDVSTGPAGAPVTLVEYSDFQCPACGAYFPLVEQLVKDFPTQLRLVYRHFPLPQHANAIAAATAAEAARNQDKFWEMYRMLFTNQNVWAEKSASEASKLFQNYAAQIGLNLTKFDVDLKSQVILARINAQKQGGLGAGVDATPTFYLNSEKIVNPSSYDQLVNLVKARLNR